MEQVIDLVGVLATDEEIIGATGVSNRNSVFIPSSGVLHYHVKKLSEDKIETFSANENFFLGYLSCIKEYDEIENLALVEDDRIQAFQRFIEQFVIIFHYMRPGGVFAPFCKVSDISLVKKPKQFQRNSPYHAVPIFEPYGNLVERELRQAERGNRNFVNLADFFQKIRNQNPLGQLSGISSVETLPDFILWKDEDKVLAIGPFQSKEEVEKGFLPRGGNLQVYLLREEWIDQMLFVHSNLTIIHLPVSLIYTIDGILKSGQGMPVQEFLEQMSDSETQQDYLSNEEWNRVIPKTEQSILESLEYHCQKENMRFSKQDRINFHISMKMDSLVILSGMSGIGKSSLAELYAKAIGAEFLNVPVSPSWNDDSDLLGYYDTMHHVYCPDENQFVSTLVEAMRNPERLYIICLDEMNLARVEHYFSKFLSLLEKKERRLRLYDSGMEEKTENADLYPSEITIGHNIRFLGTVNMDETTYHFSDKVLDRSNIIQLHVENYARPLEQNFYGEWDSSAWTSSEYNSYVNSTGKKNDVLRNCLWELHQLFMENGVNSGVGPRVVVKMEEYLSNIPNEFGEDMLEFGEAIDIQVAQRILTKVRGREEQLKEILAEEDGKVENSLYAIFDKYRALSDFAECKKIVSKKRKELVIYGYCI